MAGSPFNYKDKGFYRFYWHGKVIYIEECICRNNIETIAIKNFNVMHNINMGGMENTKVDFNGIPSNIYLIGMSNTTPMETTNTGQHNFTVFQELMHRITTWHGYVYHYFWNRDMPRGVKFSHPEKPKHELHSWYHHNWNNNGYEVKARELLHNTTDSNGYVLMDSNTWDIMGNIYCYGGAQGDDGPIFILHPTIYHTLYNR